jgi:HNH endonuclease
MIQSTLFEFTTQKECDYKDERYSVRDNGEVLRHSRIGKSRRSKDDIWTFGKFNTQTGYMEIASVRVHRIVATAFHGEPPTPEHVVDHMDTNRCNNRPDNLRWVTKLENALLNPITRKRIEYICGSVEAFLENPSLLRHGALERNFEWMRTVSPEEAKACKERMHIWAQSNKKPSGGSLGEWIYKPIYLREEQPDLVMALTPGAAQRNWRIPTKFPYCPGQPKQGSISVYAENLQPGNIFCENHISTSTVLKVTLSEDQKVFWILCKNITNSIKPWSLAKVTYENALYVHESLGTFFREEGAEKQFCLAQGLEWTGGDSIDDYC